MNRREFIAAIAATAVAPPFASQNAPANEWGSPVFDLHFHLRPQPAATLAHLDGAGVTKANLLTRGAAAEQVQALQTAAPGRFTWFNSYDVTRPDAEQVLTQAVKAGAQGFGEMKFHVAADGPELRRAYALAADLRVPILIHFQEVDHFPDEGTWSTGFAKTFAAVLEAYPEDDVHRPCGRVLGQRQRGLSQRGGVSGRPDRARRRHGHVARALPESLRRSCRPTPATTPCRATPQFTADFLTRHQDKLIFGSDCGCVDGHGGGVSQNNNPSASRMAGKCVARETLGLLKRSVPDAVFQQARLGQRAHAPAHPGVTGTASFMYWGFGWCRLDSNSVSARSVVFTQL